MYFKRLIAIAAAAALMINLAACSAASGTGLQVNGKTGTSSSGTGAAGAKPVLTVYYMFYNDYVTNAINSFKATHSNIEVKQKIFYVNAEDDFNKTLSTEILTGEGPDVVVSNPVRDVESISKIFSNGAFADLNEFISKDKDFKLTDYNKAVIDSGVFNGRREFLPIYFRSQFLFTTQSVLDQNDINIKDSCSVNELNTVITDFTKNNARKSKYLFDYLFDFYYLMNFNGESFLDYENRKCNFNSSEFKDLLRMYKRMQPVMASEKEIYHFLTQSLSMKNNVIALATETVGSGHSFFGNNSCTRQDFGEEMKIIKITGNSESDKLKPIVTGVAAINSNSKNKEYAYEFIKVLLSDEIQRSEYIEGRQNTTDNPVNNKTFEKDLEKYLKTNDTDQFTTGDDQRRIYVKCYPLSDNLVKTITGINSNMAKPVFIDKSVRNIIGEAMKDYLSGKKDEDQTAQLINNKVELFLNE